MNCKEIYENEQFENLIIYGHSLDKADYSYFFPIFDKLCLTDNNACNTIVFGFTIYDMSKENDIKKTLSARIYKILKAYAVYKGYSINDATRLVDYLSIQRRIVMYEIPEIIDRNLAHKTFFDSGFKDDKR